MAHDSGLTVLEEKRASRRPLPEGVPDAWVSKADAARVSGRQESTITGWIARGWLRAPDEVRKLNTRQGAGQAWSIHLPALYREHLNAGGYEWHPEAIRGTSAPHLAQENARLKEELAREVARTQELRAQVEELRALLARRVAPKLLTQGAGEESEESEESGSTPLVASASPAWRTGRTGRTGGGIPSSVPATPLPPEWVGLARYARAHGFAGSNTSAYRQRTSFRPHIQRAPAGAAWLQEDGTAITQALTPDGQRRFGLAFGGHTLWTPCGAPECRACLAASRLKARQAEIAREYQPAPQGESEEAWAQEASMLALMAQRVLAEELGEEPGEV